MTTENPYLLTTQALEIGYKKSRASISVLSGIEIQLKPGELVCFMGPNGVGKSTLLRTISGVQPPLEGAVFVNKKPVQKLSLIERAKFISVVLTEKAANSNLSVYELISLGRYPYTTWSGTLSALDKSKIESAIALTRTESLLTQKLHTLSDGQFQKAMIARALAQDSDLMILDEPTAHLDLNNRLEVMHLLLQMAHTTGKSVLIATHELDLALQTADRLWLANRQGSIVSGTPEDLVLNGEVERTFADKQMRFDLFSGRFKMPNLSDQFIAISGPQPAKIWTAHALERVGFKVANDKPEMSEVPCVQIHEDAGKWVWKLSKARADGVYGTIEALIATLLAKN